MTPGENDTPPDALYPVIEEFIETASPQAVEELFGSLKEALSELKGPRKAQAPKIDAAIRRAEELLSHLLHVRDELEKVAGKRP